MSTWDMVQIGINSIACLVILWSVICATNNMSFRTKTTLRLAFVLLGIGALAALISPVYSGRPPTYAESAMCLGIAILGLVDRRRARQKRLVGHGRPHIG